MTTRFIRRPGLRTAFATLWLASQSTIVARAATGSPPEATPAEVAFHRLQQDVEVVGLLDQLKGRAIHGSVVVRNVRVVDPATGAIAPGQSVVVNGATIAWVGDSAQAPAQADSKVIDGGGRFLAPGLVDMHVHTNNAGDLLLDLAAGVTTVRDMAGFPWMLRMRASINAGRMLAPTVYVSGPLFNAFPLDGYAVAPIDAVEARRMVREQAACGYDFIKVWNVLPDDILTAIAEQARALDMDLIGHVPHGIPVRHAVQLGMRTMEHLKGYLDDGTLTLGDTDYAAAVDGPPVWVTPTLYANVPVPRGDAARALLKEPTLQYVPLRKRLAWGRAIDQPEDKSNAQMRAAQPILSQIMSKLEAEHTQFLAGTDSANYPFQVRGFGLLEELKLLRAAGLTSGEILRAATSAPAAAMRDSSGFGRVHPGMRADLLLLNRNPLDDIAAVSGPASVMAHGWWLDRHEIDTALRSLAEIYAQPDEATNVSEAAVTSLVTRLRPVSDQGVVFNTKELAGASASVRAAGFTAAADSLLALGKESAGAGCASPD